MATVNYILLSALKPVELKYNYYRNENLLAQTTIFKNGYSFYNIDGFKNFQDITINRNSCFVLTSSVSLSTVFQPQTRLELGKVSGTVNLQPRNTNLYYGYYDPVNNLVTSNSLTASNFFIYPTDDGKVEIRTGGQILQVDTAYPYTVRASSTDLESNQLYRQRFICEFKDGLITLKTTTASGTRYLAFCSDYILRATGLILNETAVNDYVMKAIEVTQNAIDKNFKPSNNWVTYYMDIEYQGENKTVTVNKNFENIPTNFLVDFPVEEAVKTGTATINIANLKTGYTPAGAPSPVDNTYVKRVITTN